MRVCHVVEAGGGVAQVVIDLARAGVAADEDVTVIYAISRAAPYFINALSPLLGPKFIPISMQREVGLHDITDAWTLYRTLCQAGPFDIIHGHSSKAGALVRLIGPMFPRSVKIYSPHAFVTLDVNASRIYGVFEKILSWLPGTIVVLSHAEKEHALRDLHINPRKITVIPNGITLDYPADRATARARLRCGEDKFLVGFVGRFVPQKNPLRLIDAFAREAKKFPQLHLALIGDGIMRPQVEERIAMRNLAGRVDFFSGHTGRDLMPGFDCLLCASDYEGFPLIFLEALAAGVPIVTTPVGGAAETALEGEAGFIAEDFTAAALAAALGKMVQLDWAGRARLAANARRRAGNFSLERVAGQMQSLYAALLAKKQN